MGGSTDNYNANSGVGYHIGVAWQKNGFVYWQFGLRYNNAVYGFNSMATSKDTGDLKVQALDIPLTVGYQFPVVHQGRFSSCIYQRNALFYPWC